MALFGPPPLIVGENSADYDELLAHISAAVKPSDVLEEIWVRDVADLVWETFRLRRHKPSLLAANASKGLKIVLASFMDSDEAENLAACWLVRQRSAVKEVDKLLASAGLTMDAVMAQTLSTMIDDVERIDRMIMTMEARRNAALREIDRHRGSLGQLLRRAVQQAEDAEFEVIAPNSITHGDAA